MFLQIARKTDRTGTKEKQTLNGETNILKILLTLYCLLYIAYYIGYFIRFILYVIHHLNMT